MVVPAELERLAYNVSVFRKEMKDYLSAFGECYDKFTITEKDTFLGYVSETAIIDYLDRKYGDIINIHRWSDRFDLGRIRYAVKNHLNDYQEIEYVRNYFYDKYDLEIVEKRTGRSINIDVKTAETSKQPQSTWYFLYPVVQNNRAGKDCVILCYYYKRENSKRIILIGYITEDEISQKKILRAGTKTEFGTINQIDNFETKVTDYKPLSQMLGYYYGERADRR